MKTKPLGSLNELSKPIRAIFTEQHTRFAFLTLLTIAGYSLLDKLGVKYVNPIVFEYFLVLIPFFIFLPYVLIKKPTKSIFKEWKYNKFYILACGFIGFFGYALLYIMNSSKLKTHLNI